MTITEIRNYAKERGIAEKRVALLIAELHPDENGNLSLEESMEAMGAINQVANLIEGTTAMIEAGKRARRSAAGYTRVATDEQAECDSLQDQKDAAAEYAAENGMEPFVVDYRAGYDFIMALQQELEAKHHDELFDTLDYKVVKALAATYELQDYLAARIAQGVASGEIDPDEEE